MIGIRVAGKEEVNTCMCVCVCVCVCGVCVVCVHTCKHTCKHVSIYKLMYMCAHVVGYAGCNNNVHVHVVCVYIYSTCI